MTTENIELLSLAETPFQTLLDYMNRGFEDYLVPVQFTQPLLAYLMRVESVDLSTSRIVSVNGEHAGIALVNSRGWSSRLGAFGIFKEWRGKGIGAVFATRLVEEARSRNDRSMVLETICENHAAIKIYQKAGFEITRKLLGFEGKGLESKICPEAQECDPRLAAHSLMQLQPNLTWQASGESLVSANSLMRAFRLNDSLVFFHPTGEETANIRGGSFATPEEGKKLIQHALTLHPDRTWRLAPWFPEAMVLPLFPSLGFNPLTLAQYEMRIDLKR